MEWYRNKTWSEKIEKEFEMKLARARDRSRPQYLLVQGLEIEEYDIEISLGLLLRAINLSKEANAKITYFRAIGAIGDLYLKKREYDTAEYYYKISYENEQSSNPVYVHRAGLCLVQTVLESRKKERLSELEEIVNNFNIEAEFLKPWRYKYIYHSAWFYWEVGDIKNAKSFANKCFLLINDNKPDAIKHPEVSVFKPTEVEINLLERILSS